jgi:hypothetical protein
MHSSSELADILRNTLREIEEVNAVDPNDPAFLELKRILLLKADSLEAMSFEPKPPTSEP